MDTQPAALNSTQRTKIQILKDIIASRYSTKGMVKDAQAGLVQWEALAQGRGWPSLAAWLEAR